MTIMCAIRMSLAWS